MSDVDSFCNKADNESVGNINVFETIYTEEKAYWLGFMYADGCVSSKGNTISLSLKESDIDHIKRFRHFLNADNKKIQRKIKDLNGYKYIGYAFSLTDKKLHNDLKKCGCVPKKTFVLSFPSNEIVPYHLKRHFIRGYFDGDGSCTHGGSNSSKISLEMLGTKDFLDAYQKWFNMPNRLYQFKHSTIKRSIYGGPYAIYVLDILYKDANIYLPRKYEKYLELRRLAVKSLRTARLLMGKIGESHGSSLANTEVIAS